MKKYIMRTTAHNNQKISDSFKNYVLRRVE
jgi:hypothetical protein